MSHQASLQSMSPTPVDERVRTVSRPRYRFVTATGLPPWGLAPLLRSQAIDRIDVERVADPAHSRRGTDGTEQGGGARNDQERRTPPGCTVFLRDETLSHAVDREAFAQSVFLGEAVPIWGPTCGVKLRGGGPLDIRLDE
jgi:hypothetical protein